ncbi:hypothetical protein AMTRI_Chr05g64920 [Amborella trichopoda]|uniref:Uncharacterized protein n=1 Tax=Amborella trichopoda TaxID=13333 RepID=W1P8G0_AMBTC|nr:uncharacterized protein LOC18432048 [Amborella trichopoda]ERN03896.1 hypothetical protein AMTR_s00078p00179790 [Amborella trichopoda]|eukprot:XP_006842221.1 uncharacterized protein LOC18432048 [Amborella trichopoda]
MLLAVESGFFSSSAFSYSKGLAIFFLGKHHSENQQDNKSKQQMRVLPLSHQAYHLVQDINRPLASSSVKSRARGCASFICFGRSSSRPEGPSLPRVEPVHQQDASQSDCAASSNDNNSRKVFLKSSLKRPPGNTNDDSLVQSVGGDIVEAQDGKANTIPSSTAKRKVQWTDTFGKELTEIKEFEPSEAGASDDESDGEGRHGCACAIQ